MPHLAPVAHGPHQAGEVVEQIVAPALLKCLRQRLAQPPHALLQRAAAFVHLGHRRLACLPLELRLRGKSTRQSHGAPIYYVDLTTRATVTLEEALADARNLDAQRQTAGFDQAALDAAARVGLANGAFEESEEEGGAVVEEFFPEGDASPESGNPPPTEKMPESMSKSSLRDKLDQRALQSAPVVLADPELA